MATKPPSEDYLQYYSRVLGFEPSQVNDRGEVHALCPFHKDDDPSLSVNINTGLWKCHGGNCGLSGNREQFEQYLSQGPGAAKAAAITDDIVNSQHDILLRADVVMKYLLEGRGLSMQAIQKHRLGFDGERILVPVYKEGKPINVRRFRRPGATGAKVLNMPGCGAVAIYPESVLKENEKLVICEGEWDAILANDRGIPTVTLTGGAGAFPEELAEAFTGKSVTVLYDCDKAGEKGALQAAARLKGKAADVAIASLGLDLAQGKDITDWFMKLDRNVEDLQKIIQEAKAFEIQITQERKVIPADITDVHLADAGLGDHAYRRVRLKIHIAGKDLAPYVVPGMVAFDCAMKEKLCAICNLAKHKGKMKLMMDQNVPDELLEMINANRPLLNKIIRQAAGIPGTCPKPVIEIVKWHNIEMLRGIPDLDFAYEGRSYTVRNLYYLGHGIQPNHTYEAIGIALPEPQTQTATVLIYEIKESQDSISNFEVSESFLKEQKIFQVH